MSPPSEVPPGFNSLLLLVVVVNILWYAVKIVLQRNGYQVHWFFSHWRDVPNMVRLVRATEDTTTRFGFLVLLMALLIATGAFVYFAVRMFASFGAA